MEQNINQGWVCPKCGSVYSPYVSQCGTCANSNIKTYASNSTGSCTCGTTVKCPVHEQ